MSTRLSTNLGGRWVEFHARIQSDLQRLVHSGRRQQTPTGRLSSLFFDADGGLLSENTRRQVAERTLPAATLDAVWVNDLVAQPKILDTVAQYLVESLDSEMVFRPIWPQSSRP
jgi:hypothetical protein